MESPIKKKVKEEGIRVQMYSRYVDDMNVFCKAVDKNVEEGNADEIITKSIKEIADTIHESIQVTIDYPSNHEYERIPVLDLEHTECTFPVIHKKIGCWSIRKLKMCSER